MNAIEQKIETQEDGKVVLLGETRPLRATLLPEILEKVNDPNVPVADVSRLISREIAAVLNQYSEAIEDPIQQYKIRPYDSLVKSLRELGKQLSETEVLSKKDVLNFDGPKFQHVLTEIAALVKKATFDASNGDESLTNSVLKHFRDLMAQKEPEIRREVDKIASGK